MEERVESVQERAERAEREVERAWERLQGARGAWRVLARREVRSLVRALRVARVVAEASS